MKPEGFIHPFGVTCRDTKGGSHLPHHRIVQGLLSAGQLALPSPTVEEQPLLVPRCVRLWQGGAVQPCPSLLPNRSCRDRLGQLPAQSWGSGASRAAGICFCTPSLHMNPPVSGARASAVATRSQSSSKGHQVPLPGLGAAARPFHLSALVLHCLLSAGIPSQNNCLHLCFSLQPTRLFLPCHLPFLRVTSGARCDRTGSAPPARQAWMGSGGKREAREPGVEPNPAPWISSTLITLPRGVSFQPWALFARAQLQILLDPSSFQKASPALPLITRSPRNRFPPLVRGEQDPLSPPRSLHQQRLQGCIYLFSKDSLCPGE